MSARALKAGIDMDMVGEGFLKTLKKSLKKEKLPLRKSMMHAEEFLKQNINSVYLRIHTGIVIGEESNRNIHRCKP